MYKVLHIPTGNYVYFRITKQFLCTIQEFESRILTINLDPRYLDPCKQLLLVKGQLPLSYTFYRILQTKYWLTLKFNFWILYINPRHSNFFAEYSYKQFEIVED